MQRNLTACLLTMIIAFGMMQSVLAEQITSSQNGSNQEKLYGGRRCVVHLPPSYDGSKSLPLVVLLHGGAANVNTALKAFGFNEDADREGYIVAYPSGTGKGSKLLSWNSGGCCAYAFKNNIDDVAFIDSVLQSLQQDYKIDSKRIYATGFSNGGMMVYRLGLDLPGRFAAIAGVSSALKKDSGHLSEPISVLIIHGDKDKSIPIDGSPGKWDRLGYKVGAQPLEQTVQFWVNENGCSPTPTVTKEGPVTRTAYSGGKNGTEVVVYVIEGYGHSWPGGVKSWMFAAKPYKDFSANRTMLKFFSDHARP
jgi:polyhydroxybutyrate depolymerase